VVAKSNISSNPMNRSLGEPKTCFECDGEEKRFCQDSNPIATAIPLQGLRKNVRLTCYKMFAHSKIMALSSVTKTREHKIPFV
jgi:hypothetical protein